MTQQPSPQSDAGSATRSKVPLVIKIVVVLLAVNLVYGSILLLKMKRPPAAPVAGAAPLASASGASSAAVDIGIACGTEKERWMRWACDEFAKSPAGSGIRVNLLPMGSLEGAQAVLRDDSRINVWAPASSLYREQFVNDWNTRHGSSPILKEERLALTPMVLVTWDQREQALVTKYGPVTLGTIGQALAEPSGWGTIANKPDWGLFKFSHTVPSQSNSGLAALVLMAYDFHQKSENLSLGDALSPPFQKWMTTVERGVSDMQNSTGNMMRDMVLFGPSKFDALLVYESVAIEYLENANGRWGRLKIAYPKYNLWNDNPYTILDVPWSTPAQRTAAKTFLDFLLSVPIQQEALKHGFRPANPQVPTNAPNSPLMVYRHYGLRDDLPGTLCQTPPAEVMFNLLQSWERARGSK